MIRVLLPIHTVSEANTRGHWASRARRAKDQRRVAALLTRMALDGRVPPQRIVVTLTRVYGPKRGIKSAATRKLDSDNLSGAFKAVRDGVAEALGIDDGSARIEWRYGQTNGEGDSDIAWRRGPLCIVEIE